MVLRKVRLKFMSFTEKVGNLPYVGKRKSRIRRHEIASYDMGRPIDEAYQVLSNCDVLLLRKV